MNKESLLEGYIQEVALKAFMNKDFNDVTIFREPPASKFGAYHHIKCLVPDLESAEEKALKVLLRSPLSDNLLCKTISDLKKVYTNK